MLPPDECVRSSVKAVPSSVYALARIPELRYHGAESAVMETPGETLVRFIQELGLVHPDGSPNQSAFAQLAGEPVSRINAHIKKGRSFAKPTTIDKWVRALNLCAEHKQIERRWTAADFFVDRRSVSPPQALETKADAVGGLTSGKNVAHQGESLAKVVANIHDGSYSDASTSARERRVPDAQNDRRALVSLDLASVSSPGRFANRLFKIREELRAAAKHVSRAALEFSKEAGTRKLHQQPASHPADRSGRDLSVQRPGRRRHRRNAG